MPNIDLSAVSTKAAELSHDIVKVQRELKRIASVKCRLKAAPRRSTFNEDMTRVLQEEHLLKCVRDFINGPRKNVNTLTQDEVNKMNTEEVMKAIKAIQSKKYHTRWLNDRDGDNDDYREACRIETMLKVRRAELASQTGKSTYDVLKLLEELKACGDLTTEECLKHIREFITREE